MKTKQTKKSRITSLKRGKVKNIGFFESIALKIKGRRDGADKLPRESEDGQWISPHLDRELRSYNEYCCRIWGKLQIDNEDKYSRLGKLMDSVEHIGSQLSDAEGELKESILAEGMTESLRKNGESKLTEKQVQARRARESDKKLQPIRGRIDGLRSKRDSAIEEFSEVRNKIIEDNNSTRLICERVKEHLGQRIDVYWRAALKKNPDMPVLPAIEVSSNAEEIYLTPHTELMQKADMFSRRLKEE